MKQKNIDQLAGWLAIGAGTLDFCTGVGLVAAPDVMLRLMGVKEVLGDLVYLRFVGAFVGAVGASYLWASWRRKQSGDPALLRATLEITIIFRLAAGTFAAWAIWRGWLAPAWTSIPLTDFILAAGQTWLLQRDALAAKA
jgi:hypothetical protein